MEEHQHINEIESWLSGELRGEALNAFEKRLKTDAQFATEVKAIKEMQDFLSDSPRNQFRNTLEGIREKASSGGTVSGSKSKGKIWLGFLFLGLIAVAGYFIFNQNKESISEQSVENNESLEAINSSETTENEAIKEKATESATEQKTIQPEPSETQTKSTPEVKKTPPPKRPIAADFEPNPLIEAEMSDLIRGANVELSLVNPVENAEIQFSDGKANLNFEGSVKLKRGSDLPVIRLLLFSNKPKEFEDYEPKWGSELEFKETENKLFDFSIQTILEIPEGLYYYIFEDEQEGEYLKIGKIVIGD